MADSENSRTLPINRYRNVLQAAGRLLSQMLVTECCAEGSGANEALTKWAAWSLAYRDYSRLCSVQQRLESELLRTSRAQPVDPPVSCSNDAPHIESPAEADVQQDRKASRETPSRSDADFIGSGRQCESVNHSRAKAAEDSASAREQSFAKELWSVSGGSAVSAMAKLHCILEQGEPLPDSAEFPWPQIRSALADLLTASSQNSPAHRVQWEDPHLEICPT